jgi:glycosyltransferase involved in cell wall biosynthesis
MGVSLAEACAKAGVPLVVHFYGFDAHHHQVHAEYAEAYRASLFKIASAVVVVSRAMGNELERLGCPRELIRLIPCGVELTRFTGGDAAKSEPNLLTTMRLLPKKGPLLLIRAFSEVLRSVPEARLTIVGDGPEEPAIRALIEELNLGHHVQLTGALPPHDLSLTLRTARAYVQPSVPQPNGDTEGTPVALLEASATGLPIVASRVGGIPDSVIDGVTGFLVEPGDWQALVKPLAVLLSQPERAGKMGRAAHAHMAAHYDQRSQLAQLRQLIEASIIQFAAKRA